MKLSIVSTLYNSSTYFTEFNTRIKQAATNITGDDYQIIYVNDGSPDNSLQLAIDAHNNDPKVAVVDLSRNFGHHRAMMTGLEHARGDQVFLIDCDLEEPPELLEQFYKSLKSDQTLDAVYGVQKRRKGKIFERWTGRLFYKTFNIMSDTAHIPEDLCTVRLMSSRYVKSLTMFKDKEIYFAPLASLAGFNQKSILIDKQSKGKTSYSLLKRYHLFINAIFSYTTKPLYFMFYTGFLITSLSLASIAYLIVNYFLYDMTIDGWTSLIVSIWFFGGLTILFLGIVSIYISKIYRETTSRPLYVIKDTWGIDDEMD